jgi:hypothetical protein
MRRTRKVVAEQPSSPPPKVEFVQDDVFVVQRTAREMLGKCGTKKLRDFVARGEFKPYALDGRTVYSRNEILAFIQRLKARGPSRAKWRGPRGGDSA